MERLVDLDIPDGLHEVVRVDNEVRFRGCNRSSDRAHTGDFLKTACRPELTFSPQRLLVWKRVTHVGSGEPPTCIRCGGKVPEPRRQVCRFALSPV